jgi:transposase
MMFSETGAVRVYLAPGVTDMRKSFNGLYTLVRNILKADPVSGHLFGFCNRRRDRIKILYWDGSGLWVCAKRLEKGTFRWPAPGVESMEMTQAELNLLLAGIDLQDCRRRRWLRKVS